MTNPNQWEEEMLERFWDVHHSNSLEKPKWTLSDSVNALIPMIVKETESRTRQEVVGEIVENIEKELGAGGYPAVMFYLSRLKEQETKEWN